jgi:hypothetical protein
MEHSHRNNTPTACYYQDQVLDNVIKSMNDITPGNESKIKDFYSPARSVTTEVTVEGSDVTQIVHPYRDGIDGFPCVVYYYDNDGDVDVNTEENTVEYKVTGSEVYSGTYMFNVDKEGAQLGFELEGDYTTEYVDKHGEIITTKVLPCVSYEGAANDNQSAAAFLPYIEKYKVAIENYYQALA